MKLIIMAATLSDPPWYVVLTWLIVYETTRLVAARRERRARNK